MEPILNYNNGVPTYGSQALDIEKGLIQNTIYNPNGVITPGSLTNTQPFPVVNPNPTYIPPVNTLEVPTTTIEPTAKETEISAAIKKITAENTEIAGKSAYQTEQDTKFGVDAAQANIQDLTAQLTRIKNEAAQIPIDEQSRAAKGTFLTGGLEADQNQRLRDNAVAALGVSTLLAASQGQLANAQAMADRAVETKFGPMEAERDALIENIKLIRDDPQTSLQDRNRADAQTAAQEKAKQADADKRADYAKVQKVAIDAAANGAAFVSSTQYRTLTQALTAIKDSISPVEATQIAQQTGLIKADTTTPRILGSASTGYFSYDPNTGVSTPLRNNPTIPTTPKVTFNSSATNLQKQAIPTKALNKDGTMTAGSKKSLIDKGVPATQVDWLWNAVTSGESFENIRQAIIKGNGNPKVLDTFVQTLQS